MASPTLHASAPLYQVSKLAQRVTKATVQDFKEALKALETMKQEGRARLWYRQVPEDELAVSSFFDVSLGKEDQSILLDPKGQHKAQPLRAWWSSSPTSPREWYGHPWQPKH